MALGAILMAEGYFGVPDKGSDRSEGQFRRFKDQVPVSLRNVTAYWMKVAESCACSPR